MKALRACMIVGAFAASAASASGPAIGTPPPALVPRAETGFSNPEQRYVYGQPDKGEFRVPLVVGALPREVNVATPEMCAGEEDSWINFKYDKAKNKVWVKVHLEGMPEHGPTVCYDENPTTQFNQWDDCLSDGDWQVWLIGNLFRKDITFWYDATTLELQGSDYDFPSGPPPGTFPVIIPGVQMIETPHFEPNRRGVVDATFVYAYDSMIDIDGNAGTAAAFVPFSLCQPDKYTAYYVNGGLDPATDRFSFDEFLASIHAGYGVSVATSYEPRVKPAHLESRDNIMIGHLGFYPQTIPAGYTLDMASQTVRIHSECGTTHQKDPWPGPYHDLCTP